MQLVVVVPARIKSVSTLPPQNSHSCGLLFKICADSYMHHTNNVHSEVLFPLYRGSKERKNTHTHWNTHTQTHTHTHTHCPTSTLGSFCNEALKTHPLLFPNTEQGYVSQHVFRFIVHRPGQHGSRVALGWNTKTWLPISQNRLRATSLKVMSNPLVFYGKFTGTLFFTPLSN